MNPVFSKIFIGLAACILVYAIAIIDPCLMLKSSYVATPQAKLQENLPPAWKASMTPANMCDILDGGDGGTAREYRGRLQLSYAHWAELFTSGQAPKTHTLVCSFPDEHSVRYQRWDWRINRSYEIELLWHGFRQRGDVDVPPMFLAPVLNFVFGK